MFSEYFPHLLEKYAQSVYNGGMSESVIREKLKLLPDSPGVYLMMDADGVIIYVGKARVLKNRVRQYFHSSLKSPKVQAMVDNIADFAYVVTPTEVDALALENTYIKKYKPKYNILLKDDKTYPYIKVFIREEFPHIGITRRVKRGDGRYFGPFMGGIAAKEIVDVAAKVYHIRTCTAAVREKPAKPCLEYHLGRCGAPCAHLIPREEYAQLVEKVLAFLAGDYEEAERILTRKMTAFAENEEFELAMEYRDRIEMLSRLGERRITAMPRDVDADIWAFEANGLYAAASVLLTRGGIMQGSRNFSLDDGAAERGESFLSFLTQYYSAHELPHELVADEPFDEALFQAYAEQRAGRKITITRPKFGIRRELLDVSPGDGEGKCQGVPGNIGVRHCPPTRYDDGRLRAPSGAALPFPLSQAHGVLRHLQHFRRGQGGQHGGLYGRRGGQSPVPPLPHPHGGGGERLRLAAGGAAPPPCQTGNA